MYHDIVLYYFPSQHQFFNTTFYEQFVKKKKKKLEFQVNSLLKPFLKFFSNIHIIYNVIEDQYCFENN